MFVIDVKIDKVIENELILKNKLFNKSINENFSKIYIIKDIIEAFIFSIFIVFIFIIIWFSSLGFFSKIFTILGFRKLPLDIIIFIIISSMFFYLSIKSSILDEMKKEIINKLIKFNLFPIDILGIYILNLILPPALKIIIKNGKITNLEKDVLKEYFYNEWGINKDYIGKQIDNFISYIDKYDYNRLKNYLIELSNTNYELDIYLLKEEILKVAQIVTYENNSSKKSQELSKLENILNSIP